ncbi:thiamine transport system substrate-binding protein [Litoreibacter halocynthiae]|uniref:Thiamine transport system substrate-binding protein n=1 Tax=Litoreibacter halocynthiae TaxID=1242689 RepID=A0A4R7LDJ8_9RHOB|nr:thiamine ABC transporter substrate binding subunit [Litoreibacter halocynthiae]TDT73179.1 thiamine transport system substrate-binding protein [Litoreibacter halocynthiae]
MKKTLLSVGLIALAGSAFAEDKPVLTIYAPDYFTSEWGPGPKIEAAFEETCACDVKYVAGDVLPRLLLEGERTKADVVIGLNTDVTKKARETGLFLPHGQDTSDLTLPIEWTDDVFLPFNWGHTAFIYNTEKMADAPTTFDAFLADEDTKVVLQDPRSSISGLALMLWVKAVYGDDSQEAFNKLARKTLTVTKGWSESYGMFTDGEADMVLSYTTSPAYHIIAEEDETKRAAIFDEGHYFMTELAAQVKGSSQPELAQAFMDFVLSETFQSMISTANWSFPAKLDADKLPDGFKKLDMPEKALFYSEDEAAELRDAALDEWLSAFSQ